MRRAERSAYMCVPGMNHSKMLPSKDCADRLDVTYITLELTGDISAKARVATVQLANLVLERWANALKAPESVICNIGFHFEDGFECRARYQIWREQKRVSIARDLRKGVSFMALSYIRSRKSGSAGSRDKTGCCDAAVWSVPTLLERYAI